MTGIILIHGLAEHCGRYADFVARATARDIKVFPFDLVGHGTHQSPRGDAKSLSQILGELDNFVQQTRAENPTMRLVIFGHSFGGQIAAVYMGRGGNHATEISALVLSNPLLDRPRRKTALLNFVPHKMLGFIKFKKRHSESAEMLAVSHADPLACKYISLRLIGIAFKDGIRAVNRHIKTVACPVLCVAGKLDPLVSHIKTHKQFDRLGSTNKTFKLYEDGKHRLVQNAGSDKRIDDILDWVMVQS